MNRCRWVLLATWALLATSASIRADTTNNLSALAFTATSLTLQDEGNLLSPGGLTDDLLGELPTGDIGPIGLDLDDADGDQMVRQTAENPVAGDEILVDVFITGGASTLQGFAVTLGWDPDELTFVRYQPAGVFSLAIGLTTPTVVTATDSMVALSTVILGPPGGSADAGTGGQATFSVNEGFSGVARVTVLAGKLGTDDVEIGSGAAYVVIGGHTVVELPTGDIGPIGLDLDDADGDQMVRQTAAAAGDQITVDLFITAGASQIQGFAATLDWDPAEVTFVSYAPAGVFSSAAGLTTPAAVTAEDNTVALSTVLLGAGAVGSADAGTGGLATFSVNEGFSGVTTITLSAGSLGIDEVTIGPGAAFVLIGGVEPVVELTPAEASNFDGDSTVGFGDFLVFAGGFGGTSDDPDFDARLDLDGDGIVGFGDFLIFAGVFGETI